MHIAAPIAPPPANEAPERPAEAAAPAEFVRMIRLDATSEQSGSLVRAPADYAEPIVEPVEPAVTRSGRITFDLRKHRERFPFAGDDSTRPA